MLQVNFFLSVINISCIFFLVFLFTFNYHKIFIKPLSVSSCSNRSPASNNVGIFRRKRFQLKTVRLKSLRARMPTRGPPLGPCLKQ